MTDERLKEIEKEVASTVEYCHGHGGREDMLAKECAELIAEVRRLQVFVADVRKAMHSEDRFEGSYRETVDALRKLDEGNP